jgi:hypothetical protein
MNGAYSGLSDVLNGYYQDDSLNEHGSDATGGTWADGYTHDDKDSTEIFSENTTSGSTDTIIPYHDDDTTYGGSSNRCCPLLPTAPTRAPANDVGGSSMAAPLYGAVYQVNQSNADAPYINTGSATVESGYGPYGRSAFPTSLLPYRLQERDTDNQTVAGILSWGTTAVVAHAAPPPPTAVLTALAAAGRNPADLTLPTAGSEAVDPPPGISS